MALRYLRPILTGGGRAADCRAGDRFQAGKLSLDQVVLQAYTEYKGSI